MAMINLRKHLIEHYMIVNSTITTTSAINKSQFNILFLAIQINIVTAKSSSTKFIGICASMNCSGGSLIHNLAVRKYDQTPTERCNNQASDILINWLCAVISPKLWLIFWFMTKRHSNDNLNSCYQKRNITSVDCLQLIDKMDIVLSLVP